MRIKIRDLAVGAVVVFALAGCGDDGAETSAEGGGDAASTTTVSVDDNFFDPESVEVAVGDTVAWQWSGTQPHDVNADDFESDIQTEGTFEYTFEEAGSYPYVCTVHPGMEGTVEVAG